MSNYIPEIGAAHMEPAKKSTLVERVTQERERQRMEEAINALQSRGALKDDHCPECRTTDWNVDFLAIPSVPLPQGGLNIPLNVVVHVGISSPSSYIPALTFVCRNCGYFKIFNLNTLGLGGR